MKKTLALAVVASLAVAGLAGAAEPNPIAIRQAGQDLMLGTFTGIRGVLAAKGDISKLEEPAKAMAKWIRVFPTLFPPGSDKGETKALPAIWSDRAGFEKAAEHFADTADKLAVLIKAGDASAVAAQVKVVGEACGACHKTYRAR